MAKKKINQLTATTSIADADLALTGNATSGISFKILWSNVVVYLKTKFNNKAIINTTTAVLTTATLEAIYSSAAIGDEVICKDIADGPRVYKKMGTGRWDIIMTQFNDAV